MPSTADRSADARAEPLELVCVEACGQTFGIDVRQVREIVRARPLVPLPLAPPLVEGVMDLRGGVIPVIDLARALGLEGAAGSDPHTRIVIVNDGGLLFGLQVGAALDVERVDPDSVVPAPALVGSSGYAAVRRVVRRPEAAPILVLSMEALREAVAEAPVPSAVRSEP